MTGDILDADLLMRLGVDASGLTTELSAKLTAAERQAVASGDKISAAYAAGGNKAVASQLRVVAATERLNKTLQNEKSTLGQRASAQASVISAQQRYTAELTKSERATTTLARTERSRFGGIAQGFAAGVGLSATSGIISLVGQAKSAAVEYQDVVAANDVTFGQQRRQLDRFKEVQADALNLSRLQSEELANTFGSVFKTAGSSQEDALKQGLALVERAADVRSFRGGTLTNVSDAFRSALVGETEPIRRYGVLLDDARLRQRALDLGLVKTTKETLPPAIKAQAAYAEIMAQTSDAQGDIARTGDSAANVIEDQRQKAADAKQELGEGLLPVIVELARAGSEVAPALAGVARGLGAVLGNDVARRSIELGIAAAAVIKLGQGLNSLVNGSQAKIQANLALARSYDIVGAAAVRAGVSERSGAAAATVGRRTGGRGQLVGLGALGLLAAGSGGIGAATGSGGLNTGTSILSGALTGAGIGSFFPGPGTAIGAGVGALAGLGLSTFGSSGAQTTTTRSPAQIKSDLAGVREEIEKLQRAGRAGVETPGVPNPVLQVGILEGRQRGLTKELEAAKVQAKQTFEVFDAGTGTFKQLTKDQIAAAGAADLHKKALASERDEFRRLRDSFAIDPFAKQAEGEARASAATIRAAELRLTAARQRAEKDGATASERASVISARQRLDDLRAQGGGGTSISPAEALDRIRANVSQQRQLRKDLARLAARGATQEQLQALYGLDQQAPGTVHRIATTNAGSYAKAFDKALQAQRHNQTAFARLFDGTDTLSAEKGRRDARAYRRAYEREIRKKLKGLDPVDFFENFPFGQNPLAPNTPGRALPAQVRNQGIPAT